ncbi:MAG: ornithine cyclodeaminase family protein [Defluviicoccus sp.]|nr:ornithine cyclodeaminase family protein [Defluviicoccus sp.]MDE0274285.1 ornithine cyclodeaminase family protein [Defluviicoccus sp.]
MTLILNHADVLAAVDMNDAIEAMEAAFAEEGAGGVNQPPRTNIRLANGFLRIGPVVMERSGWMGFKAMNLSAGIGVRYQVHLYTVADGDLKAIMDAQHLTTLRTGATSAVATRRLARDEAVTVAVLGSGVEARVQLEAMHALGLVAGARVFSPTRENREAFAAAYAESLGIEVAPVGDARAAVDGAGMVVAAVKASEHAFYGAWLEPGMHVNSVGTARPNQREIDPETFARSDVTVVDTRHGVLNEAGDAIEAADAIVPDEVHELCNVVADGTPRRTDDTQITLFKSVGTGIQDIALAAKIYERARDRGLGIEFADLLNVKKA